MFRLSQMTKWIGVVTMSALLLWANSGIQVVSQQQAGPGLMRSQMLQHLRNALAQLTASGGHILDLDEAAFSSLPDGTIAYIPLVKEDPAWQLLFDLVWNRKPVGPLLIGMLYVDHRIELALDGGGTVKLNPGSYYLKVSNDLQVIAEDSEGNGTKIGTISFGRFLQRKPQRTVQYFIVGKENPVWFAVGILLIFTAGAVAGCTLQVNTCNNCIQQNTQQNNPPQGGGSSGGGGGGG
jgi:hypothetical protein